MDTTNYATLTSGGSALFYTGKPGLQTDYFHEDKVFKIRPLISVLSVVEHISQLLDSVLFRLF